MQVVAVKVDDIESGHVLKNQSPCAGRDGEASRDSFRRATMPAGSLAPARAGLRIAAGEQRHFVPLSYQFLRQVGHDAFGSTIKFGRHAFVQGSDLCEFAF